MTTPDVVELMAVSRFLEAARRAALLAREAAKDIAGCVDQLEPNSVSALTDSALEAANEWLKLGRMISGEIPFACPRALSPSDQEKLKQEQLAQLRQLQLQYATRKAAAKKRRLSGTANWRFSNEHA